jgi:hypothetical protein
MHALFRFATDTLSAVNTLTKADHQTQALIVLYSAFDTMAWVGLPAGDVTRMAFKDWVEKYILAGHNLACNAEDLYGARCALLHSHTAASAKSREGTAREVYYYGGEKSAEFVATQLAGRADVVAVRVLDLVLAFSEGAFRFIAELDQDQARGAAALQRAAKWMRWVDPEALRSASSPSPGQHHG